MKRDGNASNFCVLIRWPGDLEIIWSRLNNLNTDHGFAANQRPFSAGEVIGGDGSENFHA